MDVTSANFALIRPQIERDIDECTFAAIDCEFTGLDLPNPLHPMDRTHERYEKLQQGIQNYAVIQIGLSLWRLDKGRLHVKTYNIYTFPKDTSFTAQASSLSFLVDFGFDLNRCVRFGLPYRPICELPKLRQELREHHRRHLASMIVDQSSERFERILCGKPEIEDLIDDAKAGHIPRVFVTEAEKAADGYVRSNIYKIHEWVTGDRTEDLELAHASDVIRTAFYPVIERIYPNGKFQMETVRSESNGRFTKKIKLTRSEHSPLDSLLRRQRDERDKLESSFGASVLIAKLSNSGKPMVVHNGIRDVMYLVSQFLAPLAKTFRDFQYQCKELFPAILDTKFIATQSTLRKELRHTGLKGVFSHVKMNQAVFPVPPIQDYGGLSYTENESRAHEAGYDAWMTGYIFAGFLHFYNSQLDEPCEIGVAHPTLGDFIHKLYFGPSLDITCFDLNMFFETLHRNKVYIIEWGHPEDGHFARQLMARAGGCKRTASVDRNCLAFSANSPADCDKLIKALASDLQQPCRFYKFCNAATTTTTTSKTRRRKIRNNDLDQKGQESFTKEGSSPSSVTSDEVDSTKKPKLFPDFDRVEQARGINEEFSVPTAW